MKKIKIYIDLDNTIFNKKEWEKDYKKELSIHNININPYNIIFKKLGYKVWLNSIKNNINEKEYKIFEKISKKYFLNTHSYVFKDFDDFKYLTNFKKKFKVILLSKGDKDFQNKKINNINMIFSFFDKIIITNGDKYKILRNHKLEGSIIIDDNLEQLVKIKNICKTEKISLYHLSRIDNLNYLNNNNGIININSFLELYGKI